MNTIPTTTAAVRAAALAAVTQPSAGRGFVGQVLLTADQWQPTTNIALPTPKVGAARKSESLATYLASHAGEETL